jgi:hypothetical protein
MRNRKIENSVRKYGMGVFGDGDLGLGAVEGV